MPMLFKIISGITKLVVALFKADFQIVLLCQLTSTNIYLLMHSSLVQFNRLKNKFGKWMFR